MPSDGGFDVRPEELLEGAEWTRQSASVLGDGHRTCVAALAQATAAGGGAALAGALGELTTALDAAATELGAVLEQSAIGLHTTAAAYRTVDSGNAGRAATLMPADEP